MEKKGGGMMELRIAVCDDADAGEYVKAHNLREVAAGARLYFE